MRFCFQIVCPLIFVSVSIKIKLDCTSAFITCFSLYLRALYIPFVSPDFSIYACISSPLYCISPVLPKQQYLIFTGTHTSRCFSDAYDQIRRGSFAQKLCGIFRVSTWCARGDPISGLCCGNHPFLREARVIKSMQSNIQKRPIQMGAGLLHRNFKQPVARTDVYASSPE